jgi:hypothetical protein
VGECDRAEWAAVPPADVNPDGRGLVCEIRRNRGGAWCGYVRLPEGHPWRGLGTGDLPGEAHEAAHGGITFANLGMIGWDASHYRDRSPWREGGSGYDDECARYVTEREAVAVTDALARVVWAAQGATP